MITPDLYPSTSDDPTITVKIAIDGTTVYHSTLEVWDEGERLRHLTIQSYETGEEHWRWVWGSQRIPYDDEEDDNGHRADDTLIWSIWLRLGDDFSGTLANLKAEAVL